MFAGMRTGSVHMIVLLCATLLTACGGTGGTSGAGKEKKGAPTPEALLAKLLSGLDELHAERVASCFDQSTDQGAAIAELMSKTVGVLKQSQALESAVRAKFGNTYADEHVAIKAPALFVEGLRKRLAGVRLKIESNANGKVARLHLADGGDQPPPTAYTRLNVWFLAVPTLLTNNSQLRQQVGQVLDIFDRHIRHATDAVGTCRTEQEFRTRMVALGKETKRRSAPLLAAVVWRFKQF